MILRRLAENVRNQNWFSLGVEVFVVVIGLVLAFQVDRWWEARGERIEESSYVARLVADLEKDLPSLQFAIDLARVRLEFSDHLARVAEEPSLAQQAPAYFYAAVSQAAFTYTPSLVSHTFDDLRSTGNLRLIRDSQVIAALQDYYRFDESQRQFISLNLMVEFRYFELAAGVLTTRQFQQVQDQWHIVNPANVEAVRGETFGADAVLATAERFAGHDALIAWLPRARTLQLDQIMAHGQRLQNAVALLDTLKAYADRIGA